MSHTAVAFRAPAALSSSLLRCLLCLAAQAQEADIAERNREIEAKKEGWKRELQRNDKNLSDAALSVRTRDRKILNLNDQVIARAR